MRIELKLGAILKLEPIYKLKNQTLELNLILQKNWTWNQVYSLFFV